MYIDTHCHISSEYYDDIPSLINKIKSSGIKRIIVNGTDMKSNIEVIDLVKKYDIVYGAIGFHPTELDNFKDEDLLWLDENIDNDKIVAVGEIGLDYHYDNTNKDKEIYVFKKQLEIAKKHNKPVIVHSRDAIKDTYNILKDSGVGGSIHCFSGSLEMAIEFIKIGFLIGVGGVATYKNAKNIVNVINNIDLEYILLETDAPYLTPEPYRKYKNDSSYIPVIARKIAEIKNIKVEDVGIATKKNAEGLFDI